MLEHGVKGDSFCLEGWEFFREVALELYKSVMTGGQGLRDHAWHGVSVHSVWADGSCTPTVPSLDSSRT